MYTKQKWMKMISVALLAALVCLVSTDLVFAGIDSRTYSDTHLGTTNPQNAVRNTTVTIEPKRVSSSSLVSYEEYNSKLDKVQWMYNSVFFVNGTSSPLKSCLR